jgi:uncharacterized damage-inducible protein DinB
MMTNDQMFVAAIYQGWHDYQMTLIRALEPLSAEQLALRPAPRLRSIGMIATHMIGARARWFYLLMGEGGDDFKSMGRWDRRGARPRRAEELISGLERTWDGMQAAIARWTPEQWIETYPGEASEPETITRQWVIWHLIEHDLHHGGEISLILGAHVLRGLDL